MPRLWDDMDILQGEIHPPHTHAPSPVTVGIHPGSLPSRHPCALITCHCWYSPWAEVTVWYMEGSLRPRLILRGGKEEEEEMGTGG